MTNSLDEYTEFYIVSQNTKLHTNIDKCSSRFHSGEITQFVYKIQREIKTELKDRILVFGQAKIFSSQIKNGNIERISRM